MSPQEETNIPKQVYNTLSSGVIYFENDGPDITQTNYWQSNLPERYIRVSFNAGTFRMLVPHTLEWIFDSISPSKDVIMSRGPWLGSDAVKVVFNGNSDKSIRPFVITIHANHFFPLPENFNCSINKQWKIALWTQNGKKTELPCTFDVDSKMI